MTTATNGHALDGRAHSGAEQLLDRLNEPRTLAALNRLLDHAELLAFSADSLDGLVRRSDQIVENVTATVGEFRGALPAVPEVDTAELAKLAHQLPRLLTTANQLAELTENREFQTTLALLRSPSTLASLNSLLRHSELLAFLVTALDRFVANSDTMVENIRELAHEIGKGTPGASTSLLVLFQTLHERRDYLPRLIAAVPEFTEIVERIAPFVGSPEFSALLDSGVFHTETVNLIGRAGDVLVEAYEADPKAQRRLGPVGLVKALNDPDVQRVLAWAVDFARRFGKSLSSKPV